MDRSTFLSLKDYRKTGFKGDEGRELGICHMAIKMVAIDPDLSWSNFDYTNINDALVVVANAIKKHHVWLRPSYYTESKSKNLRSLGELNDVPLVKYLTGSMVNEMVAQVRWSMDRPTEEGQNSLANTKIFARGLSIKNAFDFNIMKDREKVEAAEVVTNTPQHIYEGAW